MVQIGNSLLLNRPLSLPQNNVQSIQFGYLLAYLDLVSRSENGGQGLYFKSYTSFQSQQ